MPFPLKNTVFQKIENQFDRNIRNYGITSSDKLLVAVSGGLDSTVLAHLCQKLNLDFHLVHMNYGLRGAASDGDEGFCRELSKKMNRPFHSSDTKKDLSTSTPNLQSLARELRYSWFTELVSEHHAKWVLTGHHFDDHAETLIHQFLRGGGPDTLTGFFHGRGFVARPLMGFRRSDILQYALSQSIEWREDESNSHDRYTRNKIRHSLLPALREYNSGLEPSLIKRAWAVHGVIEYAQHAIQQELNNRLVAENGVVTVDAVWLRQCFYQEFFLRVWLSPYGFTAGNLDATIRLLKKRRGELRVREKILRLTDDSLQLIEAPEPLSVNTKITIPFRWEAKNMVVEVLAYEVAKMKVPWALIDNKWFEGNVVLRNWKPGDRFVPSGMAGSKKVGDFLTHQKVPVSERARVLVLEKEGVILAVLGHRLSHRVSKLNFPDSAVAVFFNLSRP
jgi:tRNA(Ile)-lysidine synthase